MFKQARIKLTAWYLCIIMLISVLFSMGMYQILTHEARRLVDFQRIRFERNVREGYRVPESFRLPPRIDSDLVREMSRRILLMLVGINGAILMSSAFLGYFLAGRTLAPISNMVDEQNRFIADASHELRTPLTALKTSLEVFLRDPKSDINEAKNLVREGIKDVDTLKELSDSLLRLSQYQQPNHKLLAVDLFKIAESAVDQVKALADQKEIKIDNLISKAVVLGEESRLKELISILLDNSIKYSEKGKQITLTSRGERDFVTVSVADQGLGIAEQDKTRVFERFYRADSSRSGVTASGYGLGLSIAKKIVEAHYGSIWLESRIGQGTTVYIKLPLPESIKP